MSKCLVSYNTNTIDTLLAKDTSGVLGSINSIVNSQEFLSIIADKVMTKLVSKDQIVNNLATNTPGISVLDAAMGKVLSDKDSQISSLLADRGIQPAYAANIPVNADWADGQASYRVVNGICFVRFDMGIRPIPDNSLVGLIYNLPPPSHLPITLFGAWCLSVNNNLHEYCRMDMGAEGTIICRGSQGGYFAGTLIYPVK